MDFAGRLQHDDAAETLVAEIQALGRRAVALRLHVGDVAGFAAFTTQLRTETAARLTSRQRGRSHNDESCGLRN